MENPRMKSATVRMLGLVLTFAATAAAMALPATAYALSPPALSPSALSAQTQTELDRAVQAYEAGQLEPARAAFEALAAQQVPAAEYNLAVMHLRGEMPKPDLGAARALLGRAGQGGFVTAQLMLARGLESGELGPRDLVQAHDWYELAAEAGDAEAQLAMGTAYFLGRGRARNAPLALKWYREVAKTGDVGAQYIVASMYEHGDGVETDLRLARYWFDLAARNGDRAAAGKVQELDLKRASTPS